MFIKNPGSPITKLDIERFEKAHHVKLADEHRDFLLEFNGGSPYPNAFAASSGVEVVISRIFSLFYHALGDLDGCCSEPEWKNALKKGYIQIADDLAGQRIIIATKGSAAGAIYISIDGELYLIAKSFNDLLRQAESAVGVELPLCHDEWMRLAAEKVASGKAGVFQVPAETLSA